MATASVRDLRNHFPRIRRIVEDEGEVIVTDKGRPKYKLTLYADRKERMAAPAKDYMARLLRLQPHAISSAAAKTLVDENRGNR